MYSEALAFQKRHQNFFDFSEFYPNDKKVQPIYFSFVRHPVERIISWYYYVRSSEYQIDHESIKTKMPIGLLKVRSKEGRNRGHGLSAAIYQNR